MAIKQQKCYTKDLSPKIATPSFVVAGSASNVKEPIQAPYNCGPFNMHYGSCCNHPCRETREVAWHRFTTIEHIYIYIYCFSIFLYVVDPLSILTR